MPPTTAGDVEDYRLRQDSRAISRRDHREQNVDITEPSSFPSDVPLLRTVAMPGDTNASGAIFGGWILSQMDLAGGTFAARRSRGRVVTGSIEAMRFLHAVEVGDEVSCFCSLDRSDEKSLTVRIETWSQTRDGDEAEKVTEGLFTYVPIDDAGKPRGFKEK